MTDFNDNLILTDSRPTRSDAIKNRRVLLETASQLFLEKGVDSVSMTEIAQVAHVGKGTLYRHFNNKAELCHALLDQDMRDLQENTLQRLSRQQDPLNTLKWFVRQVIEFVDRNYELLIEASETGDIPTLSFPAHLWWRQTIQGLLSRIDRNVDVDYLSDVLYVMLDVNTFSFQRHTLNYDVDRIISGLIDLVDRLLTQ